MRKIIILAAVLSVILCSCGTGGENGDGEDFPKEVQQRTAAAGADYSNTKICWGFKKIKNSAPEIPAQTAELLKRFDGYYIGDKAEKNLYLTFDEGYENGYTPQILDVLKKTGTPAAFFITGQYIKEEPELVKRMTDEGHIVGNHTVHHPSMPEEDDERIQQELNGLNKMYNELTGKSMLYLRPPKGEFSERTLAVSKKLGYKTVLWSSAYVDWDVNKQQGASNAVKKITEQFHNGNIILMHAVSRDNAEAMEEIIGVAKKQGFTFKSLDNLCK